MLKAFLRQTDIVQYVEHLFAESFEKANNFSSIPKAKRRYLSRAYQSEDPSMTFPESTDKEEHLSVSEVIMFCQEILNTIEGSLAIMPQSVRHLLKSIEIYAAETVRRLVT
eukprot:TRINITY_DN13331_c0_g2_i1.p3 TRINITY_DN13331_c0_g2~~TRINITY_DN13331_c0_g2_i1.p3  ORF type:complete len:111 (-),score=30.95 TRINITY_DN13331_c0_g2_i1:154-486(-)